MLRALLWLVLGACLACEAASKPYAAAPAPPALPRLHAASDDTSVVAVAPDALPARDTSGAKKRPAPCALGLHADAHVEKSGIVKLRASVHNTGAIAVTLSFADRCPQGAVEFSGLPAGYDLYHACNKGACFGARKPLQVVLAAGQKKELVALELDARGGSCTPLLKDGSYRLLPRLVEATPRICKTSAATFQLGKGAPVALAMPEGDPHACQGEGECVLSCPNVRGCCGHPCGCQHALNRAFVAAYEASYARTCDKPPCPAVGCMMRDAAAARCQNGRCVAVDSPAF